MCLKSIAFVKRNVNACEAPFFFFNTHAHFGLKTCIILAMPFMVGFRVGRVSVIYTYTHGVKQFWSCVNVCNSNLNFLNPKPNKFVYSISFFINFFFLFFSCFHFVFVFTKEGDFNEIKENFPLSNWCILIYFDPIRLIDNSKSWKDKLFFKNFKISLHWFTQWVCISHFQHFTLLNLQNEKIGNKSTSAHSCATTTTQTTKIALQTGNEFCIQSLM